MPDRSRENPAVREDPPFLLSANLRRDRVEDFARYPFNIPAVAALERGLKLDTSVTYFIGENGSGKSTIVEALAVAAGFNPEGGTMHFNFATRPSESSLHHALKLIRSIRRPRTGFFLRAESFFNVATAIERMDEEPAPAPPVINSYGGKSLHEQSHGESFLALIKNRFGERGLYVLDEPEAALSPPRQLTLLRRVHELVREGSQFLIATHSPIVMAYPGATIYRLDATGIASVDYEETEHVVFTRDFLNNKERFLAEIVD
jgi:predicted ATPase